PVASDREQILLLEASGHNVVYANGQIRAGDVYGYGYVRLPVLLHAGTNDFLFQGTRGTLRVKLSVPTASLMLDTADSTLPDLVLGEREAVWGAALLLNATTNFVRVALQALKPSSPAYRV